MFKHLDRSVLWMRAFNAGYEAAASDVVAGFNAYGVPDLLSTPIIEYMQEESVIFKAAEAYKTHPDGRDASWLAVIPQTNTFDIN